MAKNPSFEQSSSIPSVQFPTNIWIIFTISIIAVALVSGGGVYLWLNKSPKNVTSVNQIVPIPTLVSQTASPSTTVNQITPTDLPTPTTSDQIKLGNLTLIVPAKWKIESNNSLTAKILTDFQPYRVELLVSLENDVSTASNYKSSYDNTTTKYGEAFKVAQGGSLGVTGVKINNKLYSFAWEISSNEPVPTKLDGIWTPSHNVTQDDLWNITVSAKPVGQISNQDSRKELSADGWNQKFLDSLNKGDTCNSFYLTRFTSKPNTFVTYVSSNYKYSLSFPFNSTWGDTDNKVKPYESYNSGAQSSIWFGQPFSSEGCSFVRPSLSELPASNIDDVIKTLSSTSTSKKITTLQYPILDIDTENALFGSVKSYKIFLPTVTLEIDNVFNGDVPLLTQLVDSIKLL